MGTWVHHLLIFAFVVVHMCIICSGNMKDEKRALLCFKEELQAPKDLLSSWVDGVDCCSEWEGVVCDNVTGHVIELHPTAPRPNFYFLKGKLSSCLLELKELRRLDLSGLSDYLFSGTPIPSFIGSFANLQYLDLSFSGFQGFIPHQLGNLSSLRTLRLGFNYGLQADSLEWLSRLSSLQILDLSMANLSMVYNWHEVITMRPSLRKLYLAYSQLPKATHSHVYGHNTSSSLLQVLDLTANGFISVIPRWIFNLSNLLSLNLSGCGFIGPFPDIPWNFTSLNSLDISYNELNGPLPSQLFGLRHLASLNIGSTQFQDALPSGFLNVTSLKMLDASGNHLNSYIPNWIYDFTTLQSLSLSRCQLLGTISNSISNLTSLSSLDLSYNMFIREIPKEIGKLNKLQHLDLSSNKLRGPLPESLGYAYPMMEELSISDNMLEGIVTERHFVNLTKLKRLDASGNKLTLNVSPNWTPPFQLDALYLGGSKMGPQFPDWLRSQHQISEVDISNAGIESEVPTWFWNFSSGITLVNLSHNHLQGQIENISVLSTPINDVLMVYLGSNQFRGPLPHFSNDITELDLSNNLFSGNVSHFLCHAINTPNGLGILHLGGNRLSGEIPDCWMHWPYLGVINLSKNKLVGSIPNSIGPLNDLVSLDLHDNMLSGNIPWSMHNCIKLVKVDLGENRFTGVIPRWLGTSLSHLRFLRLRSNNFYGELPLEFCHLTSLSILDLSHNRLFGVIPKCLKNLSAMIYEDTEAGATIEYSDNVGHFGENALVMTKGNEYEYDNTILLLFAAMDLSSNNFTGNIPTELANLVQLRSLNLSNNNFMGSIPSEMGNMKLIESLDLSRNHLSGEIPLSFSSLSTLEDLDLSYNNLSGHIPSGTQLQGFNASCYIGNNLCGPPISKGCGDDDGKIPKLENKDDDDDDDDDDGEGVEWFYVSMAIGFAVGLWGVCGSLLFVKSWRIAYFRVIDGKLKSLSAWGRARRAFAYSICS